MNGQDKKETSEWMKGKTKLKEEESKNKSMNENKVRKNGKKERKFFGGRG